MGERADAVCVNLHVQFPDSNTAPFEFGGRLGYVLFSPRTGMWAIEIVGPPRLRTQTSGCSPPMGRHYASHESSLGMDHARSVDVHVD